MLGLLDLNCVCVMDFFDRNSFLIPRIYKLQFLRLRGCNRKGIEPVKTLHVGDGDLIVAYRVTTIIAIISCCSKLQSGLTQGVLETSVIVSACLGL